MAVVYLNPDGSSSVNGWDASYSSTPAHLAQNETSNEWRTAFLSTGKVIFTLGDFDNTGVASITKIENILICGLDARGGSAPVICAIRDMSGGGAGTTLYEQTFANAAGAGFQTFTGTARTTSDGSSAWTDSDLDNLGLFMTATGGPHVHIIQQFYIKVTYVLAGYGHDVSGLTSSNIGKINGLATANIGKVSGLD